MERETWEGTGVGFGEWFVKQARSAGVTYVGACVIVFSKSGWDWQGQGLLVMLLVLVILYGCYFTSVDLLVLFTSVAGPLEILCFRPLLPRCSIISHTQQALIQATQLL